MNIIYYTDNTLDGTELGKRCQELLTMAAEGKVIISVSQKPINFGDNLCVGEIGRSHHSLFTQALRGAELADDKYIALAEHDCLYTPEHFNWIPPSDEVFYYNVHHWFAQWSGSEIDGMYSYHRRKAMSQLICNRELFIQAIAEKIEMLETGFEIRKGQPGACEPGVCDNRQAFVEAKLKWLAKDNPDELAKLKDVGKEDQWKAEAFGTVLPNIDIRHKDNFSGGRRSRKTRWQLPYWGEFKNVMEASWQPKL